MFYIMYLTNLCHRRRWPDPLFDCRQNSQGWTCRVRVNNREYTSDAVFQSEELARENAAESAYMICRNFSVNDGMYPGQRQGQAGVTQGLPVAIGTGRRGSSRYADYSSASVSYGDTSSGSSSPRNSDSELESTSRRSSGSTPSIASVCYCRRAYVSRHQRCEYCLREAGWY